MRPIASTILGMLLLASAPALGQTVVEMDMPSAAEILQTHKFGGAVAFLLEISNNYRKYTNVRVRSGRHHESLALLAQALRTDFDGSGTAYIPDLTIWSITGNTGARILLVASLLDRDAVLLSSDLDYLKGMVAYELLQGIKRGTLSIDDARRRAIAVGIEMQVTENEEGERTIFFFGHHEERTPIIGKLVVIEPPDLVWD